MCFFLFYFLTCSLFVFPPNGKQRFPINICSQENTCLALSIRLHQPILRHPIYVICSARNCLAPGGGNTPLCLTTLLSRTSKREQRIQSSPRLHVKMSKWLYGGEFQEYISHCRTPSVIYFIDSFIYLFYLAYCVEPSLVTTHPGGK